MFKTLNDEIYCTGGYDYCFIKHNGEIYKCNAHGCNSLFPIGSIKDNKYKKLFNSIQICQQYVCSKICDMQMTQHWQNNKKINNPNGLPWNQSEKINEINKNNFLLHAELVQGCINGCSYCSIHKNNLTKFKFIDIEYWQEFLSFINERKKETKSIIICGGGEQTVYPNLNEFINSGVENNFKVTIITSGLNCNDKILSLDNISNICMVVSLHPTSPLWNYNKIKTFLSKLKNKNMPYLSLNLVNCDKNMLFYDKLKKEISDEYNIPLNFIEFNPNH